MHLHVAGYIQSPLWDGHTPFATGLDSWAVLPVPRDSVVILSVTEISWVGCWTETTLSLHHGGRDERHTCQSSVRAVAIYDKTVHLHFRTGILNHFNNKGFKLAFSLHTLPRILQRASGNIQLVQDRFGDTDFYQRDNLWNCSVPFWDDFILHFPCNARWNCVNGEDEAHCPYTNHSMCDIGQIWIAESCYRHVHKHFPDWMDAAVGCNQRGGALASLQTVDEWETVKTYLAQVDGTSSWIGMKSFDAYSGMM